MVIVTVTKPGIGKVLTTHHGEREGVDVVDVFDTVLPGDQTLDVDEQLVPDAHDGFVILLVPGEEGRRRVIRNSCGSILPRSHLSRTVVNFPCVCMFVCLCVCMCMCVCVCMCVHAKQNVNTVCLWLSDNPLLPFVTFC